MKRTNPCLQISESLKYHQEHIILENMTTEIDRNVTIVKEADIIMCGICQKICESKDAYISHVKRHLQRAKLSPESKRIYLSTVIAALEMKEKVK